MSTSADTPIFSATDRTVARAFKRTLASVDVVRQKILRSVLVFSGACVLAEALFDPTSNALVPVLVMGLIGSAGSAVYIFRERRELDVRPILFGGLRTARACGVGLVPFHLVFAAIVAGTGPLIGLEFAEHLVRAACYGFLSLGLYALPLDSPTERPLQEAAPTEGPRVEYERLRGELIDLKRREQDILDRKTELERHPDINRA